MFHNLIQSLQITLLCYEVILMPHMDSEGSSLFHFCAPAHGLHPFHNIYIYYLQLYNMVKTFYCGIFYYNCGMIHNKSEWSFTQKDFFIFTWKKTMKMMMVVYKHVFWHWENKICRPGHLSTISELHYNAVLSHNAASAIRMPHLQPLFYVCKWLLPGIKMQINFHLNLNYNTRTKN